MKFNKHGLAILYKKPANEYIIHGYATPRVFHYNSDVHVDSVNILGSRGAGKSMWVDAFRTLLKEGLQ